MRVGYTLINLANTMSSSVIDFKTIPVLSFSSPSLILFYTCLCLVAAFFSYRVLIPPSQGQHPRGCRKLGVEEPDNLIEADGPGLNGQLSRAGEHEEQKEWKVKSLWVYPIKSCKGVELQRGAVISTGMEHDRHFSFAQLRFHSRGTSGAGDASSEPRWNFITQRQYPLLTKVIIEIWVPDVTSPSYSPAVEEVQSEGVLVVRFPYVSQLQKGFLGKMAAMLGLTEQEVSFQVPFRPTDTQIKTNGYQTERMTIWKDSPEALNMSMHVPWQLQEYLGMSHQLGLFRVASGHERLVFRCAPRKEELGWQPITGFTDAVSNTELTTKPSSTMLSNHSIHFIYSILPAFKIWAGDSRRRYLFSALNGSERISLVPPYSNSSLRTKLTCPSHSHRTRAV